MNVLLVYPNIADHPKDISFGLATISAVLKQAGHSVDLLDATFGLRSRDVRRKLESFHPQLVGITVASNDFDEAAEIGRTIRAGTDAPIIAGGFHATVAPEEVLALDCFDAAAIGEGDVSFLEVARSLEGGELDRGVAGMWFKSDRDIIRNGLRPFRRDPAALPFPDRSLFDYARYVRNNRGLATFLSAYGCPYPCSYCINHHLARLFGSDGYVREKPLDYLLAEIAEVVGKFRLRGIEFYDETFTLDRNRVLAFCDRYPHEIGLPFAVNARAHNLDREMLQSLKAAGCTRILVGIECGNPDLRRRLLRRPETDEQIVEAFRLARDVGLQTHSYNMVGLPFETERDIGRTVELNRRCGPDYLAVSLFNAYKGTDLHRLCAERGWLSRSSGGNYFQETNVRHPEISLRRLKRLRDSFGFRVFLRTRPLRAVVDLVDKKLLRFPLYHAARSRLIRLGAKRLLGLEHVGERGRADRGRKPAPAPASIAKKILFLNAGGEWYGSDKILFYVIGFLTKQHDCLVILPFGEILDRKLTEAGVRCVVRHYAVLRRKHFTPWRAPLWFADFLVSTARLGWMVVRYKPDIIYSNSISVLEGAVLSRLFGTRHIWHMHDILERPAFVGRVLRWCARRFADDVICVSKATARHIGSGTVVKTVHNGIPPVMAEPQYDRRRDSGIFTVGVLGRFNAHKGQLDLLRAVDHLRRGRDLDGSLRVLLVGGVFGGDERWRDRIRRFIDERGLGRMVELREFTERIEAVYPELDLFVLPTIQPDPFPTVVLEAMSCGVPVVAYRSGGVEEALDHDPDCLVDLGDYRSLGRTVLRFMEDEELRREKARRQHERFRSCFTLERFEEKFATAVGLGSSGVEARRR